MTTERPRRRAVSRDFAILLATIGVLAVAASLAWDLRFLSRSWHHFAEVERAEWLEDYSQLKGILETRYPNLDWVVTRGGLDLARLDARTSALLEDADSREEALRILRGFLAAFHDGHLGLLEPANDYVAERPVTRNLSAATPPSTACAALGYEDPDGEDLQLDFERLGSRPLPGDSPFPARVVSVEGRKVGFLRIRSFDPTDYAAACRDEWERLSASLTTTCESPCVDDFKDAVISRLLDELGLRIRQLREAGVELLAVDVRGNGGGRGSFQTGAAELLAGRRLPEVTTAVVCNDWTVRSLEDSRRRVERTLAICSTVGAARARLEATFWRFDRAIAEASIPCDRKAVWTDWGARPQCDGLVPLGRWDGEVLAEIDETTPSATRWQFPAVSGGSPRTRWNGRLAVLTNRGTASAAEILAGSLHDDAGATTIGQRTAGDGGGWMFGRVYWTLEHSGLHVYVPDHAAFRADGTSYAAGVSPDIVARFEPRDPDWQRTAESSLGALKLLLRERPVS